MKWINTLLTALAVMALLYAGCSGSDSNPAAPGTDIPMAAGTTQDGNSVHPTLLGYFDVYIDPEAGIIEVVPNRNAEFLLNIVTLLNKNPANITFGNFDIVNNVTSFDIGLDWTVKHPAPIPPDFDVFDMRGVIVLDGSGTLTVNPDLTYGLNGTDQVMMNADGYSRWFNKTEFIIPGLGGYTTGTIAFDTEDCGGTFNPYIYYADDLGVNDNLYDWLLANEALDGRFTAGATLTRRMVFNFPIPNPGINFGYAFMCNWEAIATVTHTPEAVASDVQVTDDVYFDGSIGGGNLILDISLFGWDEVPSSITVESTVLSAIYVLSASEMTPTASGDNWATWHVEIPADDVTAIDGQEFWVIAEYAGYNYLNPFGIQNDAGFDTLAAGFRYDLTVSDTPFNLPPEITDGVTGDAEVYPTDTDEYTVTADDPEGDALTYAWTVTDVATSTVVYSGPGDGAGTFIVGWANNVNAYVGDEYEIDCGVRDPTSVLVSAITLAVSVIEPPNEPPVIYEGVSGPPSAAPDSETTYYVNASDINGDTITYDWTITKTSNAQVVYQGPGDGTGFLSFDWSSISPILGETYEVDCGVTDSINPPVYATTLVVIINQPPVLISGVNGDSTAFPSDVKDYNVVVNDPDGDTITYLWGVTEAMSVFPLYTSPGDGNGSFTVDWANDVDPEPGDAYVITCEFNDEYSAPLKAIPLFITIQ